MTDNYRQGTYVLNSFIDSQTWHDTLNMIHFWSQYRESKYICICNVHSVVTASRDKVFQRVINEADIATPDGAPIAWMLRLLGFPGQQRINGPDLMWRYCEAAENLSRSIFLYGNTEETLAILQARLLAAFPSLHVAGIYSPPFRPLTQEEDEFIIDIINKSSAHVVFVSLGCPKQEKWMAEHRGRINAVMIGVGAAFDYHAGTIQRAPVWMQRVGLEWFYRLTSEPGRLWKRYFITNILFLVGIFNQMATHYCSKLKRDKRKC